MFLGLILILFFTSQSILLGNYLDTPIANQKQLQFITAYLILSIVGIGLVFGVATIFLLERQVISRLSRLNKSINNIAESGDISTRLSIKGADELSNVAGAINGMLAALQEAETKLKERYKEEKTLRRELQAEINKRVEFTRALVHEIKTPLTPVVTASELLLDELKEERALNLAQSINKGAHNLNQRIDELLDLARGEVGMLSITPNTIDPMQLLQEIAQSTQPVAQSNGQSLILELPSSLPPVWADEDRLRQAVLNLINNAFKFTPEGGKITLRARKDGVNLVVEVQDTGYGISKEAQQWVFEPYHQIESKRARHAGLGIGLSLSKKLVELHGGHMWVNSQEGKGSTFSFSIPFKAANQKEESSKEVL